MHESMIDDLAHTLQQPWRNLQEIQQIVTQGKWGKRPGELKSFDQLRVQLREELHTRGNFETNKCKDVLEATLKSTLRGVRVPTIMLLNPTGKLSDLNLDEYAILDCEPLHDLKGHLINMCKELPYLLTGDVRKSCEDIIAVTVTK